jgi:Mrp family chromosome partitioning ATPase
LVDYLASGRTAEEVIREVPLGLGTLLAQAGDRGQVRQVDMVSCLTAGSPAPNAAELLGSQRFRDLIGKLRGMFDVVVLDTAPLLSVVDTRELLQSVDAALLCVRASQTTREEATAAKDALSTLAARPYCVVATGLRGGDQDRYGYYSYSHAYAVD